MRCAAILLAGAEEQGDTPQACQTHQTIYQAGKQCHLTAQQKCHQVQTEQGDRALVQCADDGECQCDSVPDQRNPSSSDLEYGVVLPETVKIYAKQEVFFILR